jgi:parallel beta-helix repeat protein
MKHLKFSNLALLLGCLAMMFSCTKDELSAPTSTDPALTARKSGGATVTLTPTGGNDTDLIQDALRNAAPGDVIFLEEGTFYVDPIYVEDFEGTFKGAGMDKTFIEPFGDMNFGFQDQQNFPEEDYLWPFLVTFRRGDFRVSDMTLHMPEGINAIFDYVLDPENPFTINALAGLLLITGETASSVSERLGIVGENGAFNGYNVINGIYIESSQSDPWRVSGTHAVRSCYFNHVMYGSAFGPFGDVTLEVGGNASKGNFYENVEVGIEVYDVSNSQIEVSYNEIHNPGSFGMSGQQGLYAIPEAVSNIQYKHNKVIGISGVADGCWFRDFGIPYTGVKTMNLNVSHNTFDLDDTFWGGIYGSWVQDALIKNNTFKGEARVGLYFYNSSGWTVLGNNFQNLDAGISKIYLAASTHDNTVVGGHNSDNCMDFGTNNILTGVNNMGGNPPGPEIMILLQQQHELWHPFNLN